MSFFECDKCGGIPGVTHCCTDANRSQPTSVVQALTVEAIEAACDDADKNSEYSCGFYAGVRWYEAHLRAIARATHKEQV